MKLKNFYNHIKNLDKKNFLKYTYIISIITLLLSAFIIYRYFSKINLLKKELKKINNARQEAQVILSKNIQVKEQKASVENIINKGKNFKLLQYFNSITQKLGIANIKEKEISTNDLENLKSQGYTEIKLTAVIPGTNMKQLVDLLYEFENNERIYTKSLEITKMNSQIDATIVIGTIQPKSELTEITE